MPTRTPPVLAAAGVFALIELARIIGTEMPQRKQFQPRKTQAKQGSPATDLRPTSVGGYWLYGLHPVTEALGNTGRRLHRLLYTREIAARHPELLESARRHGSHPTLEEVEREALDRIGSGGAVHQGIAVRAEPLGMVDLFSVCDDLDGEQPARLVVLDQVTDPHNVGAILRSAAAFGAAAVVVTERHAALESGALAKAASGALEHVPLVPVTNLARALDMIKNAGLWCLGLAADGAQSIADAQLSDRVAVVLGAEGTGLRRLTRERCDLIVRLPTAGPIGQLNVSNAAAVALYELARRSPRLSGTAQTP
jgi:23S rRNA (guanosine2251-2'-O)-methyltransferase